MLRIYDSILVLCSDLRPLLDDIQRRDVDLARQLRRALASVPLNVAEGSMVSGGNRVLRYRTALGSLRESLSCLELSACWGYIAPVEPQLRARFGVITATLLKCVQPR